MVPEFVWPKSVLIDGVSVKLRHAPYSFGTKLSLVRGTYEEPERALVLQEVRSDDVVFEMGSSIGIVSSVIKRGLSETGLLISCEASERLAAYSRIWLEGRNCKVLTGFAFPVFSLGDRLTIEDWDEDGGSLGGTCHYSLVGDGERAGYNSRRVFDLATIIEEAAASPTILVVDIEGAERIVSEVSPRIPMTVRAIIIELHEHAYGPRVLEDIIRAIENEGLALAERRGSVFLFRRPLDVRGRTG